MAGRPSSRRARRLRLFALGVLRYGGAWRLEDVFAAIGYGDRDDLSRVERAAVNMAARDLKAHPLVEETYDGRLVYDRAHEWRQTDPPPGRVVVFPDQRGTA